MCLSVKYPGIQGQHGVIAEEKEQIFESFGNEEALLNVISRYFTVVHIFNPCVATTSDSTVLLQCLRVKNIIQQSTSLIQTLLGQRNCPDE